MGSLLWSRGKWEYKVMISFFGKKGNTHSVKGRNEKTTRCRGIGWLQIVKEPTILPPSFMRGVAEGRGEPEYLHSKYSEIPTFLRKVGTPSDLALLGHLPHSWGRQALF
jgi:hypothetical protein